MSTKKTKKLTPAQREAKRERDRRYRENKKAKLAKSGRKAKAKLTEKVKLGKPSKLPLQMRAKTVAIALRALSMYLFA